MGMAFFGPALVLLTLFLFLPMLLTVIFSFTDFFALNPDLTHFVGLKNYSDIFKDELFTTAFWNTVKFVLIIVPAQTLGALGLALLINKATVCKKYFKVAFFIPVVMSKLNGKSGEMIMGIRGEDIKLDPQSISVYEADKKSAVVENAEVMGNENNLYFTFGGSQTIARVSKYEISGIGDKIDFVFNPSRVHFFDKNTEVCYV